MPITFHSLCSAASSWCGVLGHKSRSLAAVGLLALVPVLAGCPKGDVGAPCNHGKTEPPQSKLVTFPALSCDELLCVYADEAEPPADACQTDADCNEAQPDVRRFECAKAAGANSGLCRLRIDYVLERSMCSKKCSSDADCKDGGIGKKVVVDNTQCAGDFKCRRIQSLGEFCCEKLCVCEDDLGVTTERDMKCAEGSLEGCCVGPGIETPPDACGKP